MCGFLGEFSFNNSDLTNRKSFHSLLSLSKHRGPDHTGMLQDDYYQVGFNRLAILDVTASGNQPKESPSKKYTVVFNGEIYNYKELQKKHHLTNLQSTSDTEVLIHLLDKYGIESTIKMLNGMYSIAIVDKFNKTVTLVRDFAGIKPLFYGRSKKGIVFASQFNQVFKHPWHNGSLKLRPEVMKEYFGFGFMHAPNTIYDNIFQVEPGEFLQFSSQGKCVKKAYLKFPKSHSEIKKKKPVNFFDKVLKGAVSRQLISDVPLASFLSGGIDSPLITAIAKDIKTDVEAFTFGIDHVKYDESTKAKAYAKHLKIRHTLENVNVKEIVLSIDEHFQYLTEPFGDYSSIPTFLITKKARNTHTVMLSGDGGDELFFGYPRMLDILNKRYWFYIPFGIRRPLIAILNHLKVINTWAPYTFRTLEEWVKAKQLHILPEILDSFFEKETFSKEVNNLFEIPKKQSKQQLLHWLRWNEFYGHMQRVLIKVDRMSMGNSLEVRVPFLDKESIAYAWDKVPLQLNNTKDLKKVLKNNLAIYYPNDLIQTQKKGFSVPIDKWLRKELKKDVMEHIFNKPFYGRDNLNVVKIKKLVSDFYENKHNNAWGVWHVYAWQKWAYKNFN